MTFSNIIFQAYIPIELGKPLLSYFQNDPRFNPATLSNYAQFRQNLMRMDNSGMKWISEPITGALANRYFATDNVSFHSKHTAAHTSRLKLEGNIELSKVGSFTAFDSTKMFFDAHKDKNKKNVYTQHSDYSHCVTAALAYEQVSYMGSPIVTSTKCNGYFKEEAPLRSEELILNVKLKNDITGPYFSRPGTNLASLYDTTIIDVAGSAGYPYLEPFSPNIDLGLKIKLVKKGNSVLITIDGIHNKFPAYELIVDGNVLYNYNPVQYGYKGPTPINLTESKTFQKMYLAKMPFLSTAQR